MATCNTNCIEKPISKGFGNLGNFVGRHPWWFLIIPLFISAGLGGGFFFLEDRKANGIEEQFTPVNGPAKHERAIVKTNFPTDDNNFSGLRLYTEGTYASLILSDKANVLSKDIFAKIVEMDQLVKDIKVSTIGFKDICAKTAGNCRTNSIFDIVKTPADVESTIITYPFNSGIFTASEIGGVKLKPGTEQIESATAIRLFYFLNDVNQTVNTMWLTEFMNNISKTDENEMLVSYFTSLSREEEFEKSTGSIISLFSVTYTLAITFSIMSCTRLDCVRNKVWVATFGVLSAGLAVVSSFGLLLYCGMPFTMTVASAPFLILGIGVDDMFIMISCWQKSQVHNKVEDRMAETYKDAAVSITITTLTDALAFYIGLLTPFGSVQSFCMYTGTAVVFCYLYNITLFGAFLALNGRREKSNRHWLTCMKVPEPTSEKYNMCCEGGHYDKETGKEEPMPINNFFKNYYGPFLTNKWTKGFVMILYAGYLAASIYGCFQMKEGIDLKQLATDDSYVGRYYDDEDNFSEFGPNVMVVVTDTEFRYWDADSRDKLDACLHNFEDLIIDNRPLVAKNMTISWLNPYLTYGKAQGLNLKDKRIFIDNLPNFFNHSAATQAFRQDVNFSVTDLHVYASRLFVQTVNIRTAIDEKDLLNKFRKTAKNCPEALVVYHPAFIFFDQYAVIVTNTIQNIVVATVAMLVVSLLLIPSPICSLWVTFAIASVIVGVAGFMALWDVNLDSVSMINLVICIGFSVDFSAHISYAFVSSKQPTADKKLIEAVFNLGYPIIQGALSTILGVVVLSASESYIFRTFFKIMFLVILFGAFHGVTFIPVFLSLSGKCSNQIIDEEKDIDLSNKSNPPTGKNANRTSKPNTTSKDLTPGESINHAIETDKEKINTTKENVPKDMNLSCASKPPAGKKPNQTSKPNTTSKDLTPGESVNHATETDKDKINTKKENVPNDNLCGASKPPAGKNANQTSKPNTTSKDLTPTDGSVNLAFETDNEKINTKTENVPTDMNLSGASNHLLATRKTQNANETSKPNTTSEDLTPGESVNHAFECAD